MRPIGPVKRLAAGRGCLIVIVLAGFGLRVSSLLWGIPLSPTPSELSSRGYYDADEPLIFDQALGFPGNYFRNPLQPYGSTVPYLVGLCCLPFRDLCLEFMHNPRAYELLVVVGCRLGSVLAGTGTIALVYVFGKRFGGRTAGLVAAALLSVSFTHCTSSCYGNVDIWMGFLLLLNFAYLFRAFEPPGPQARHFLILGGLTGLLLGTKITAVIFLIIPVILCVNRWIQKPHGTAGGVLLRGACAWLMLLGLYVVTAGVVYAATNWHVARRLPQYVTYMRDMKRLWFDGHPAPWFSIVQTWWFTSRKALGTPVLILATVAIFLPGRTHSVYVIGLMCFVALYYGLFPYGIQTRYVATLAPIFCFLAGCACARFLTGPRLSLRILGGYATAVALVYSCASCMSGLYYRFHDPREVARHYLLTNVLGHCTYACADTDFGAGEWLYPPLEAERFKKVDLLADPDLILVDRIHLSSVRSMFNRRLIDDEYTVSTEGRHECVIYGPNSPLFYRLYGELIEGKGNYELICDFEAPRAVSPDYSSAGILIFASKARLNRLGLRAATERTRDGHPGAG